MNEYYLEMLKELQETYFEMEEFWRDNGFEIQADIYNLCANDIVNIINEVQGVENV